METRYNIGILGIVSVIVAVIEPIILYNWFKNLSATPFTVKVDTDVEKLLTFQRQTMYTMVGCIVFPIALMLAWKVTLSKTNETNRILARNIFKGLALLLIGIFLVTTAIEIWNIIF